MTLAGVHVFLLVLLPSLLLWSPASATRSTRELRAENMALRALNEKLRALAGRRRRTGLAAKAQEGEMGGGGSNGQFIDDALGAADLALLERVSARASTADAPCVEVDDQAGVDQATSNFCLAPAECQERMFTCRRHCVQKCWQTDYAKGGAAPGAGDLDQDRLEQINTRVEQKLKEIGVDLGCSPCSGGSTAPGSGGSGSEEEKREGSSGERSGSAVALAPTETAHRFASLRANDMALEKATADEEGVVKLG
jgi:hypothetical protein